MGNEVSSPVKVFVVTGSRADYGHLKSLLKELVGSPDFSCSLIVTGSHLMDCFGNTVNEIERDGFSIAARVQVPLDDDSQAGISKALGSAITQISAFLVANPPDAVIVYGDRWEMFGAAVAATLCTLPLVHIGGGDITEGAYDESFRHSMTKMSHLHFTTHELAKKRVIQMGEDPKSVFDTGSLAIDSLKSVALLSKDEFEKSVGFAFQERNILVTYHPTTLKNDIDSEMREVLSGISALPAELGILFTAPSLDSGSLRTLEHIEDFARKRDRSKVVTSLGQQLYITALSLFDCVVGNSSSGLYEVPSFKKPTINIGDRQGGRLKAESVIDVPVRSSEITEAIVRALSMDCRSVVNPYGDGEAARKIVEILRGVQVKSLSVKKYFCWQE